MRFRSKRQDSRTVEINLIPMMDVLMTVLTFFIIVSMTLTSQRSIEVQLPQTDAAGSEATPLVDPLVVGLNLRGQILLNDQPLTPAQLTQQMQTYLTQHRDGTVILQADRAVTYQQVMDTLALMREVGGDRVSLAIESQ